MQWHEHGTYCALWGVVVSWGHLGVKEYLFIQIFIWIFPLPQGMPQLLPCVCANLLHQYCLHKSTLTHYIGSVHLSGPHLPSTYFKSFHSAYHLLSSFLFLSNFTYTDRHDSFYLLMDQVMYASSVTFLVATKCAMPGNSNGLRALGS